MSLGVKLSFTVVILFIVIGVFSKYLANDVPLYVNYNDKSYYPLFSGQSVLETTSGKTALMNYKSLQKIEGVKAIYPLIPFRPKGANIESADYQKPLQQIGGRTHVLGTNQIGEDTLAGLVHGAGLSLKVGFFSMFIALIIGLFIGTLAAFLGNKTIRANAIQVLIFLLSQVLLVYYLLVFPKFTFQDLLQESALLFYVRIIVSFILFVAIELALLFAIKYLNSKRLPSFYIPIDNLLGRFIEFVDGLPLLMILISFSVIVKPSAGFLIIFIGLTAWVPIARLTRAEVLKIRNSDFMNAMKLMNMPWWRVIIFHLLPNALGPAVVAFSFGVGAAILTESTLSFLGVGLPDDIKTWGMILSESRDYYKAWWLVWSPGVLIFLSILSFYNIGQFLRSRLNPESLQV
ncbi:MAG: ABC transporter permease [Bacteroidia bacterium]